MSNISQKQKGIAIITTLVVLSVVFILGLAFATSTWMNYKAVSDIDRQNKAYNAARAGLNYVKERFVERKNDWNVTPGNPYREEKELTESSFIIQIIDYNDIDESVTPGIRYQLISRGFEAREFRGKSVQITAVFEDITVGESQVVRIMELSEQL